MPRNSNPGNIKSGPGKAAPGQQVDRLVLTGHIGPGDADIGVLGHIPDGGITVVVGPAIPTADPAQALGLHVDDPTGAHAASAIETGKTPNFIYDDAEGNLRELQGGMMPPPAPGVLTALNPIVPDWGVLNLYEMPNSISYLFPPYTVPLLGSTYPLYYVAPTPMQDYLGSATEQWGRDPGIDPIWRVTSGAQGGFAQAGGFPTQDDPAPSVLRRSLRLLPQITGAEPNPSLYAVSISGIVYPADRGVLALLHWPVHGSVVDFLAQPLLDRCVAALLLGGGLNQGDCCTAGSGQQVGDGEPGGIFSLGYGETVGFPDPTKVEYNPFAFPGRATGQYDLEEIHTGVATIGGLALKSPWDSPIIRVPGSEQPAWGQVRLGTVSEAVCGVDPTLTPYGIPILGATASAYVGVSTTVTAFFGPSGSPTGGSWPNVGQTLLMPINFFKYRLPCLKDYSYATGLPHTPHGTDPLLTQEAVRFFDLGSTWTDPNDGSIFSHGGQWRLAQAGAYTNYPEDNWTWQIARYRHCFYIPGSDTAGVDFGSYFLMHFKTEADFEKFVRDGLMPWDATEGYQTYTPPLMCQYDSIPTPESYSNVVNTVTDLTAPPPLGMAPDYGYSAQFNYLLGRSNIRVCEQQDVTVNTASFTWVAVNAPMAEHTLISGVAYLIPFHGDGTQSFVISALTAEFADFWVDGYRTDDEALTLTAWPSVPPAQISSLMPVIVGVAPFAYEGTQVNLTVPATFTDINRCLRKQHIAFPYTRLGAFTENAAPQPADVARLNLNPGTYIEPQGDLYEPAFSEDAVPRAFARVLDPDPASNYIRYGGLPYDALLGHGVRLEPTNGGGAKLLFHSTGFTLASPSTDLYGNFVDGASAGRSQLFGPVKDTTEKFLDEMYRYEASWAGVTNSSMRAQLSGPGMQGWAGTPIGVPVRAGYTNDGTFQGASFTRGGHHAAPLSGGELQVAGLPDRNPQFNIMASVPFPSAGLLRYPSIDYSVNYMPTAAETGYTQPDYSAASGRREYIRAFDASFSASTSPADVVGQSLMALRIDGLTLADFTHLVPGPGGLGRTGIAIMVKLPGQTTWMDLGRLDGDGPSKQDALLDGAGCQVSGQYTFNDVDPITRMVYCQVLFNAGPVAALAANSDGEVPLLVKVVMEANGYDLTSVCLSPGVFGAATVAAPPFWMRGLTGIRVLHPSHLGTKPDDLPPLYP